MASQQVFLTGGTGFIGQHFLKSLAAKQRPVRCMVRATSNTKSIRQCGCQIVTADLQDVDSLTAAIRDCGVVFHVAGKARNSTSGDMMQTNVQGTRNIAIACQRQPIPPTLIYFSSLAAAGPSQADRPLSESASCQPVSQYGVSKLTAEQALREFAAQVPISIIRPPIVFGEEDTVTLDLFKAINRFRLYLAPGLGAKRYSLIHADDLVAAALAIESSGQRLVAGQPSSGIYFASYPDHLSSAELAQTVAKSINRKVVVLPVPHLIVKSIAAANELISIMTPWKPFFNWDKAKEATAGSWICDASKLAKQTGVKFADPDHRFQQTAEGYRRKAWL